MKMQQTPLDPMPTPPPASAPQRGPRAGLAAALAVTALLAVALWALIGIDPARHSAATQDQNDFHLIAIRTFAEQWPEFDLVNYRSATTPGYHLAVAAVARFITGDERALRAAGSLFTLGLVLTLGVAVAKRGLGTWETAALALPVACSSYIFAAGAWLLPDNAGWLGVLAVLLAAWAFRPHWRWYAGVAVLLAALVMMRQIHFWAAGVVWLAAWMGRENEQACLWGPDPQHRIGRTLLAALATLPALAVLAYFVSLWGGLVPPMFVGEGIDPVSGVANPRNAGGNPAAPAAILALTGALGLFYTGYTLPAIRRAVRGDRAAALWIGGGAALALLASALPRTSWSLGEGRFSGIWSLSRATPTLWDRSPLLIAMATLGGALLGAWLMTLRGRDRWLFAATWAAFIAAHAASAQAWHRYYEPFILIALAIAASRIAPARADTIPGARRAPVGPMMLAGLLAATTLLRL